MSEPAAATPKPGDAARQYANMIWQYRQAETVAACKLDCAYRLTLSSAMRGIRSETS